MNLDYICIKHAQQLPGDEKIFRKALGVLEEDGVYAMFLWLERNQKKTIINGFCRLLNDIKDYICVDEFEEDFNGFAENLKEVASDLESLILVKKILQRTLIYALYHAGVEEDVE